MREDLSIKKLVISIDTGRFIEKDKSFCVTNRITGEKKYYTNKLAYIRDKEKILNKKVNDVIYEIFNPNKDKELNDNLKGIYVQLNNLKKECGYPEYFLYFIYTNKNKFNKINSENMSKGDRLRVYCLYKHIKDNFYLDMVNYFQESEDLENANIEVYVQNIRKKKENKLLKGVMRD